MVQIRKFRKLVLWFDSGKIINKIQHKTNYTGSQEYLNFQSDQIPTVLFNIILVA